MSSKILLTIRSLFFKNIGILFFLVSFNMLSQSTIIPVSRIHTHWKGYWTSNAVTGSGNRPDRENNLLAFSWNGVTYSTGVNDNVLTSNGVTFNAQKFRALKIQTLGLDTNMYYLQGSMIDESAGSAFLRPALTGTTSTGAELASRLTDGTNGLSLGTGIANIKAGVAEFKIGTNNINTNGLNDNIPDIIVTQVAEPGNQYDTFKFIDAAGNTVGTVLSIKFDTVTAIGTYSLDLFRADNGAVAFSPAATRDIRMLGIEASAFGINSSNAAQVDRFVVTFSGSSDCAFIAFNSNSLKIAELSLVKKASMSSCGKLGDKINYTFEVTNTRDVPITDITVTDPLVPTITGNPIALLAPGAKATLTGTYTITAADVAAGRVVNSAKVTGKDPSLNIIEDISGATNNDNIATTTILLTPPTTGIPTPVTCTTQGTVTLTDMPSGTWTLERNPGAVTTSGSGTSYTVTGLAVGTYTFRVTNSVGCKSPSTGNVVITNQSSTTWSGTGWSNDKPDASKAAIISGAFTISSDLTACSLTINPGIAITVPSNYTLTVVNALTVSPTASLTFENHSSLVQVNDNAVNSGNIKYKRIAPKIRRGDFVYWSTPVTPQKLVDVSPLTLGDKYFGYSGDNWVITNKNTVMKVGKGYIIRGPQTYSLTVKTDYPAEFNGVPNNGVILGETLTAGKPYLIGNPYPSALSAKKFLDQNTTLLEGTLYFWTHNTPVTLTGVSTYTSDDYASYNLTGSTVVKERAISAGTPGSNNEEPSGFIGAGQSFFAISKAGGTVTFNNDMRLGAVDNTQFFKSASKETAEAHHVWLNMTNTQGVFKQMLVGYVQGATNEYEDRYDGVSFNANPYVDFYSVDNGNNYVIQGRALPFTDTDQVALGYNTTITGDFTISIDKTDGDLSSHAIYLEDKKTGVIHDLTTSDYTFSTEKGTFTDRLVLRYTNKTLGTGDFENIENGLLVSVKEKTIKVTSSTENIKEVTVFDISGKLLYSKKKAGSTELQIQNLQSANQVLLVKVTLDNDFTTTKKIIFN
ncbi:T9SS sorting signal type C domain-containing protein [Flavobacterium pectinovorum]|uniref:DUF7507 domain-containing protein n=1 Tax=Flavobacterium pectinovorum TaxID=29533 RepID=UPI00265FDFCF|nr:T9SS sorting signal type C domain-containing protein [Flavobacterium pectinovorum]WKL46535.1 T9SS sorting signal type C domain-containing protein [Flavobacterium pectinovorum]